jgi:hypothetical protein
MTIRPEHVSALDGGWQADADGYRVFFWELVRDPPPPMWECSPWRLTGAGDILEAIQWANANADGRRFMIYAEVRHGQQPGLVLVYGADPTRGG